MWFTGVVNPVNVASIGEYIRQQREQAKISLRQLASAAGVSNPYLSQIERGLRRPSAEILQQIAKGLRISAEALYVQAGILEDRRPDSGVRAAVLADPELTERQKQVLLEIYESFRRELVATVIESTVASGAEPPGLELAGLELAAPEPDGTGAGAGEEASRDATGTPPDPAANGQARRRAKRSGGDQHGSDRDPGLTPRG
jgi:transcriptional regulator with XRE-family HTH domain